MLKIAIIACAATVSAVAAAQGVVMLGNRAAAPAAEAAPIAATAVITPAPATTSSAASIAKSPDGHFWAQATVNGAQVRFLVDTGATAVALSPNDAKRLGIFPAQSDYRYKVMTASGEARAAQVHLRSVAVAGARVDDVEAYVIENGLDASLLGMTYLNRLSGYEASQHALILRP